MPAYSNVSIQFLTNKTACMPKAKVKLHFGRYKDADLNTLVAFIIESLTGNPYFTNPVPSLDEIIQLQEKYNAALIAAANMDRLQIAIKNQCRRELENALSQLAMYINYAGNGDESILTSSGFPLAKRPERIRVDSAGTVNIANGITSGELVVSIKAVKGASGYLHEITPEPVSANSQWQTVAGSRCKNIFRNLQPGQRYWFRVAAVGSNRQVVWSSVAGQYVQ
jgi:hypothetical protein